ncbi:MAG: hypothetical protein Q4E12_05325 [Coriobacteriia bacterium]|nr:hypothetical protein [Coriobacteriia bacterium]
MLNHRVVTLVDAAQAGTAPTFEDILFLLEFSPESAEAAYACAVARQMTKQACEGMGLVHAQIGLDKGPCPENCRFCSFAAVNAAGVKAATTMPYMDCNGDFCRMVYPTEEQIAAAQASGPVPLEDVLHFARLFDQECVHLISLMATAALPFEQLLEAVSAVREAVSPDMPLLVNCGDVSLAQAQQLKDAGAQAAYHARRLQEGEITDIAPDQRFETIRNLRAAGLALMTGVEPVWPGVAFEELAARICEIPAFDPYCIGACKLTCARGTAMEAEEEPTRLQVAYVAALVRLCVGLAAPVGGSGGVAWVDAGTDPRSRGYDSADAALSQKIADARKHLRYDGWDVPTRPLRRLMFPERK